MRSRRLAVPLMAAALLGIALAQPAKAQFFSQGPDYSVTSYASTTQGIHERETDGFTLTSAQDLAQIQWWGGYGTPSTDDYRIQLYQDNGSGAPNTTPLATLWTGAASSVTDTGKTFNSGQEAFQFSVDLSSDYLLKANTTYYVSIVDTSSDFAWVTADTGSGWYRYDDTSAWNGGVAQAFALSGPAPVPEASTLVSFGGMLGMGSLAALRRRRRMRA